MNQSRWITKWWMSLIGLLILTTGSLQAQMMSPMSGIKLAAAKIEMSGSVKLVWTRPAGVTIDSYQLYRGESSDTSKAVKILDTKDTAYTDVLPLTFVAVSRYSYFVIGKPTTGALIMSNIETVYLAGIPPIGSFKLTATADVADSSVDLSWTKPPVDTVVKYYVYRYGGIMSSIQLIDSTTGLTSTDKPPLGNMLNGKMSGGSAGSDATYYFTYYVRAKLPAGTSLQSTSAAVFFTIKGSRDIVSFQTTPVLTAQTGVLYTAKVLATSSDPTAKITYVLDKHPNGMTLDLSGVAPMLKWTPTAKGMEDVRVIARSDKNGEARQDYDITVAGGNGIVSGKVISASTDAPIAKVIIQLMQRDKFMHFNYSTVTNEFGEYRFSKLDPGTYILQAIPTTPEFIGQWFDGKYNADNADKITVSDSTSTASGTIANFKLLSRIADTTKLFTVSGSVRDTLMIPVNVKGTYVTLVRSDFALNSSTSSTDLTIDNFKQFFDYDRMTDFRIEGNSKFSFRAKVDSLGNYSLKVPQGSYIALARAPGYAAEFYKEHADLLSADIIAVSANTTGIDFTLAPLPPVLLSSMSGTIMDTVKDVGVRSRIIAFRDTWTARDGFKVAKTYFTDTDSLGRYAFTDLLPGSYIVLAVPMGSYAPAYYTGGTQADSTGKWWKVSRVVLDSGNSVSGIDIIVRQLSATRGGFTWIKGRVTGKGFGLAGALVFAHDGSTPAGYGVTDVNGNYAITGLAPGSYTVSVDKQGYGWDGTAQTASPSYNTMMSGLNTVGQTGINFSLNSLTAVESPAASASVVPTEFTVSQNYPNPFNPSTTFQFMLPTAQLVKVRVYDLLGREVATLVNRQMTAGTYTVQWNGAAMPSGVYFYRVEAGSSSLVRKMILMK